MLTPSPQTSQPTKTKPKQTGLRYAILVGPKAINGLRLTGTVYSIRFNTSFHRPAEAPTLSLDSLSLRHLASSSTTGNHEILACATFGELVPSKVEQASFTDTHLRRMLPPRHKLSQIATALVHSEGTNNQNCLLPTWDDDEFRREVTVHWIREVFLGLYGHSEERSGYRWPHFFEEPSVKVNNHILAVKLGWPENPEMVCKRVLEHARLMAGGKGVDGEGGNGEGGASRDAAQEIGEAERGWGKGVVPTYDDISRKVLFGVRKP